MKRKEPIIKAAVIWERDGLRIVGRQEAGEVEFVLESKSKDSLDAPYWEKREVIKKGPWSDVNKMFLYHLLLSLLEKP